MLIKDQIAYIKILVRNLVNAEIANSCKGSGYPEDREIIEEELKVAKRKLKDYLNGLEGMS